MWESWVRAAPGAAGTMERGHVPHLRRPALRSGHWRCRGPIDLHANDLMASDNHSVEDVVPRHLQTSIDISAVLGAGVADRVASTTLGNDPVFVVLRP